jgi:hypothetical protein
MIQQQENYYDENVEGWDVWKLIQHGFFKEACKKADIEFDKTKEIFPLRNKVYALFHLNLFEEAIELIKYIIRQTNGDTDTDFIFLGAAYWALNDTGQAIHEWQSGEKAKYSDPAGGIDLQTILYFGSLKIGDDKLKLSTEKKINRLMKPKAAVNWPGPLGTYLLNDLSDSTLLSYISATPILRERQLCQANFAIGVKKLKEKKINDFKAKFTKAISYGPPSYLEQMYYVAKIEINSW